MPEYNYEYLCSIRGRWRLRKFAYFHASKIFPTPRLFTRFFEHLQILALELLNRRHKSSASAQVLASIEDESPWTKDKSRTINFLIKHAAQIGRVS